MSLWHHHPGVRTGDDLTLGERAADTVRNGMGSWPFVGAFLLFMLAWGVANSALYLGGQHGKHGFDPYPYILLNLMLSTLAGLQGAILLIAAKRADQISSELAMHTFENTTAIQALLAQDNATTDAVRELTQAIHDHVIPRDTTPSP